MTEWKEYKLSDIGTIVGGATPSTKDASNYDDGEIAWLTPKDLSTFTERYISRGERNITEKGFKSSSTQMLPANTVLFSSRAPIGYVAIAANEMCTNQGFKSIIPNSKVDYLFLYYLLKHKKNAIEGMGSGTTFKEVSGNVMKNIEVQIPTDINIQKKIADVLDKIDSKIENNTAINRNISEQLQSIYLDRFSSELNGTLSDLCEYSKARVDVLDLTEESYFSTENMLPNKMGATTASGLPNTEKTPKCIKGDVLISNIRPYFKKIVYCHGDAGCSADVLCFTSKRRELSPYIYATLYVDKFFDYMVAGSKGTKMPRGDKQQIMQYPIHIPTRDDLDEFVAMAENILDMIHVNEVENKNLQRLRDSLLPKLMSGELDVSDLDIYS